MKTIKSTLFFICISIVFSTINLKSAQQNEKTLIPSPNLLADRYKKRNALERECEKIVEQHTDENGYISISADKFIEFDKIKTKLEKLEKLIKNLEKQVTQIHDTPNC